MYLSLSDKSLTQVFCIFIADLRQLEMFDNFFLHYGTLPELSCGRIYRPSFRKNKPKRSFSIIENERFGLFTRKLGL